MERDPPYVCIEYCRQRQTCVWTPTGAHKALKQTNVEKLSSAPILDQFWRGFLPEGYPDSVTPDYLAFQAWDSVQALCSYVRGMICSQAILQGIGVGEQVRSLSLHALFMCQGCTFFSGLILSRSVRLRVCCLGVQAASPLAAVFQFFVRDLAGMLGGVLFAFAQASFSLTDLPVI